MNCILRSEVRTNSNPARGKGIFLEHNNCRNRLMSKLFNKKHFVLRHQLDSDVMFVVNYSDNRTSGTSACMWFLRLVFVLIWEPQLWHLNITHWYHNRWQHLERPNSKHVIHNIVDCLSLQTRIVAFKCHALVDGSTRRVLCWSMWFLILLSVLVLVLSLEALVPRGQH